MSAIHHVCVCMAIDHVVCVSIHHVCGYSSCVCVCVCVCLLIIVVDHIYCVLVTLSSAFASDDMALEVARKVVEAEQVDELPNRWTITTPTTTPSSTSMLIHASLLCACLPVCLFSDNRKPFCCILTCIRSTWRCPGRASR